jgi:hypothetical protein
VAETNVKTTPFAAMQSVQGNPLILPLALGYDLLTLPYAMVSGVLSLPALPNPFGNSGSGENVTVDKFTVRGEIKSGVETQSIRIGSVPYAWIHGDFSGQLQNTGNVPFTGTQQLLILVNGIEKVSSSEEMVILNTGASTFVTATTTGAPLSENDSPGPITMRYTVRDSGGNVVSARDSGVIGSVEPIVGIVITGDFAT